MCKLLGIIANKPIDLEISLLETERPFKYFGRANHDGWGIGWYEKDKANVFKECISVSNIESQFPILSKKVWSKILITHVRRGTGAPPAKVNSHPFKYKNWIFAHNGSVDRKFLLQLLKSRYKKLLKGETDSEVYFYYIVQCIEDSKDVISGIKKAVEKAVSAQCSGLNFLLSDGKFLYAFRYARSMKKYFSLYELRREPSKFLRHEMESKETRALLRSKALKGEKAVLLCSEKLTEEKWAEVALGSMFVIGPNLKIKEIKILE